MTTETLVTFLIQLILFNYRSNILPPGLIGTDEGGGACPFCIYWKFRGWPLTIGGGGERVLII